MEQIIQKLHAIRPLSPGLEARLRKILQKFDHKKGGHLQRAGLIASHILFIETGLTRSYSLVKGKRVTNWFMKEGDIIISVVSFLRQVAAKDSIEALERTICWGITHAELYETYALFPEFLYHGLLITSEYYCRSEERHESLRRRTPEDKYAIMMVQDPDLMRRVRNEDMASFIGVSRSTYGKIRSDFRKATTKRSRK